MIAAGAVTVLAVSFYEGLKTLLFPRLALWESHLVTIAFFTVVVPALLWRGLVSREGRRWLRLVVTAARPRRSAYLGTEEGTSTRLATGRRVTRAALLTLVGMTAYESGKQILFPRITIWESHLMTIAFATAVSTAAAYAGFRRYESVNRRLAASLRAIQSAQQALRESEERYRSLVLNAGEGICIVDTQGRFRLSNPACDRVFGVPPGTLAGRSFDGFIDSIAACDGKTGDAGGRDLSEITIVRADGERRILLVTSVPQPEGSMRICYDVTEHKRSAEALARTQRLAALGTLAAGVAHEFNNVHLAILGSLELALLDVSLSQKSRARLTTARDAIGRATGTTRSMMAFARVDLSKRSLTSPNDIVTQTVGLLQSGLESEGIDVKVSLGEMPSLFLDGAQISQVVMNLIINAQHAMLASEDKRLEIETGFKSGRAFIRVRDTGCGISEKNKPKLFHPFFTTKGEHARGGSELSKVPGTGIGLNVCETIVHAHGGEIAVESVVGAGSVFTVWMPLADRPALSAETETTDAAGASVDAHRSGRILVLEDVELVRDVIAGMLRHAGHTVEATDDGREALGLIERQSFDIVMVDLQMPKMGGIEFLERLKSLGLARRPVALVMTGKSADDNLHADATLGVAGTLLKPFSRETLVSRIRMVLDDIGRRPLAPQPRTSAGV